jgi:hypothetical protein
MRPMMLRDMRAQGVSEQTAQHFIDMFVEEFAQEAPQFVELGAIAYANTFSDQELRDIAVFLDSPTGRAMVEHQAEIAGAMMQAGIVIGDEVATRVLERSRASPPPDHP